tara:strand:- start:480 stop:605 length:126 start_codon:yes stop_codon:yes gene_type:complete
MALVEDWIRRVDAIDNVKMLNVDVRANEMFLFADADDAMLC